MPVNLDIHIENKGVSSQKAYLYHHDYDSEVVNVIGHDPYIRDTGFHFAYPHLKYMPV